MHSAVEKSWPNAALHHKVFVLPSAGSIPSVEDLQRSPQLPLKPEQPPMNTTSFQPLRQRLFRPVQWMLLLGVPLAIQLAAVSTEAATYSATVSSTGQQTIKGWGCNADFDQAFPNRPLFQQALYVDLGLTMDRLQFGHDCGSDDQGNVKSRARWTSIAPGSVCSIATLAGLHHLFVVSQYQYEKRTPRRSEKMACERSVT